MHDTNQPLVSVVVPAYNAAATLGETLDSVTEQSWRNLEIIVVDDGSRDDTASVAAGRAARDPRIRVVATPNGGVAAARNVGIRESRGDFVAPVDADDLWHPRKIDAQMRRIGELGPRCGFVYCLARRIDARSRIIGVRGVPGYEGPAFLRALALNFVGNGSAPLFRRAALEAVGGYEPALHRNAAQGAEDYLMQALVAYSWTVGCVPEFLLGYRTIGGTMSGDPVRMARSHLLALDIVARDCPEAAPEALDAARALYDARIGFARLRAGRIGDAVAALGAATRRRADLVLEMAVWSAAIHPGRALGRRLMARLGRPPDSSRGLAFAAADPRVGPAPPRRRSHGALLARLAAAETLHDLARPIAWRDSPAACRMTA